MLRESLLVTVALLAAAASVTPAVAALQLASDGNVDATLKLEKDTALRLLLFGEPAAKKKISKKKPECNFPFILVKTYCAFPCYYSQRPAQAYCMKDKAAGKENCPAGFIQRVSPFCLTEKKDCSGGKIFDGSNGCYPLCKDLKAGSMNEPCKRKSKAESCPTNYKPEHTGKPLWCVNKVCDEGFTPSAKDGSCKKGCPKGSKPKNGKCAYICDKGYKSTPEGGCKVA